MKRRHTVYNIVYEYAESPDIDLLVILAHYYLWRDVNRRPHSLIVRVNSLLSRESEVDQLQTRDVVGMHEHDVLNLDISVDHTCLVTVVECRQQLLYYYSKVLFVQLVFLHEVDKSTLAVFLDQEYVLMVLVHFEKLDYIGMVLLRTSLPTLSNC